MKEQELKAMRKLALITLIASGADIVAPEELLKDCVETAGLKENKEYEACKSILDLVEDEGTKLNIIKTLIVAELKPSQVVELQSKCGVIICAILAYLEEHPEQKEEVSPATLMDNLLGGEEE